MEQKHFHFNEKKRVVVKIGSSSLNYGETGNLNFTKLEHLVRELCNLRNRGMDVCLVSSGAIAVGRQTLGMDERPKDISTKQACAAVGQARLMMIYQRLFAEYNQVAGQVLMTKNTMVNPVSRENAKNTFDELFRLGAIPIVNENDTVSTYEMQFGDNDTLSAIVASLMGFLPTIRTRIRMQSSLKWWRRWMRRSTAWRKVRPVVMLEPAAWRPN